MPSRGKKHREIQCEAADFLIPRGDFPELGQRNLNAVAVHFGQFPELLGFRELRVAVEKQLQTTTGDFCQGELTLGRKNLGPLVKLVRKKGVRVKILTKSPFSLPLPKPP